MSILNDPRVSEIDGGYRVINAEFGPVKVFRTGPDWAVFFDSSTSDHLMPQHGMIGSRSSQVEETVQWAAKAWLTTEDSR